MNISNFSWSNHTISGTQYMPALDCYLLTFLGLKCRIHTCTHHLTTQDIHPMLAVMSVSSFFLQLM